MESKGGKENFLYELPSPLASPRTSTRNISKMQTNASKQEKYAKKHAEWQHDHQPPSSFYNSTESNESKKKRIKGSQDSVSDSNPEDNNEVASSSLPGTHRFSFRIMDKKKRSLSAISKQEPHDIAIAVRTLDSSMFSNDMEIEKAKEHKSKLNREIERLRGLVSDDDAAIRTYERANMQLKTQREALQKRAFGLKYQ